MEFFRALFTCGVDFLHMGVAIAKKTMTQIYVPRLVEVALEALDEDGDGAVSVAECMGLMDELLHRDPSIRDTLIRFQYAMFGDNSDPDAKVQNAAQLDYVLRITYYLFLLLITHSDPDAKVSNKAQLDAEGHILVDILNLVGQEGTDRNP